MSKLPVVLTCRRRVRLPDDPDTLHVSVIPRSLRGAFRDRHERWAREAMDAEVLLTNGTEADDEVVWS